MDLPPELAAWMAQQPSPQAAWDSCARVDWLLRIAAANARDPEQQHRVVEVASHVPFVRAKKFRIAPTQLELARIWADPKYLDGDHWDVADIWTTSAALFVIGCAVLVPLYYAVPIHDNLVRSLVAAIPMGVVMALAWPRIGRWLKRRRVEEAKRALEGVDFARAFEWAVAVVEEQAGGFLWRRHLDYVKRTIGSVTFGA
jgi:hypothetical protein